MIHNILIQNKPDNFILCNLFLLVVLLKGLPFQNGCQLTDFHFANTVDDQNLKKKKKKHTFPKEFFNLISHKVWATEEYIAKIKFGKKKYSI